MDVGVVNGLRYYSWSHKVVCCLSARHALFACVGRMLGSLFMECRLVEAPLLQVPGYQSIDLTSCYARSNTRRGIIDLFELQVHGLRRELMRDVNGLSGRPPNL